MRRSLILAGLGAALAAVGPAGACDPEALNMHLTGVCEAALAPAEAALEQALPHATAAERALIERHRADARGACATGDPQAGARTAAQLARIAGRIEGRVGLDGPVLAAAPAR
ncbi:hypothetical protein GCM10009416_06960 [Craurococcus roseus]|uniref:UrcA family protein n=1 Tax=Craurococcus roseus TaxID=77585 RepID=A0ABN1EP98_9PROT